MDKKIIRGIGGFSSRKLSIAVLVTIIVLVLVTMSMSLQKHLTIKLSDKGKVSSMRVRLRTPDQKQFATPSTAVVSKKEIRHIGFLKVHKAASSTMQNIFYRFGLKRNLSFILPKSGHYLSKYKYLDHYNILPPFLVKSGLQKQGKYDILCNHVVFNYGAISDLLHEQTVYIAIVREPLRLFLSSAYYYKYVWNFPYLAKLADVTFVTDLIHEPNKYEAADMAESMTYNSMAYDFGLDFTSVTEAENITEEKLKHFLTATADIFKLVLIVERFDESLVLIKRYLNWELSDIIYLPNNVLADQLKGKIMPNISREDKIKFRHRNRFDYSIYEIFKARFEKQFETEVNIKEETQHFQDILQLTRDYCLNRPGNHQQYRSGIHIEASIWNEKFTVSEMDCELMLKNELPFVSMMQSRHEQLRKQMRTLP